MNRRRALHSNRRPGLTLLEAVLALTILGIAMAMLQGLLQIGIRSAATARDLTQAQLLCQSKLAELASGALPLESVSLVLDEFQPDWLYSVETAPGPQEGMVIARVSTVHRNDVEHQQNVYSLTRWILDPQVELDMLVEEAEAEQGAEEDAAVETAADASESDETGGQGGRP